jgi:hypothetical protein
VFGTTSHGTDYLDYMHPTAPRRSWSIINVLLPQDLVWKMIAPSLTDYTNFHGMLCHVETARRCLTSFNGVALFADQSFYNLHTGDTTASSFASVDYNNEKLFPLGLTVMNYYLLVLFSLTGPCTLCGQTRVLRAEEGLNEMFQQQTIDSEIVVHSTETKVPLGIPSNVLNYIRRQSANLDKNENLIGISLAHSLTPDDGNVDNKNNNNNVVLKRRFEFDFGGYLSVMMLHFVCHRGRTHLVEVYRLQTEHSLLGWVVTSLLWSLRRCGTFLSVTRCRFGRSTDPNNSNSKEE